LTLRELDLFGSGYAGLGSGPYGRQPNRSCGAVTLTAVSLALLVEQPVEFALLVVVEDP